MATQNILLKSSIFTFSSTGAIYQSLLHHPDLFDRSLLVLSRNQRLLNLKHFLRLPSSPYCLHSGCSRQFSYRGVSSGPLNASLFVMDFTKTLYTTLFFQILLETRSSLIIWHIRTVDLLVWGWKYIKVMASLSERSEVGELFDRMTLGVAKTLRKHHLLLCLLENIILILKLAS